VDLDANPKETRDWKEIIPDKSRSPFDVACDSEQHLMIEAALEKINPIFRESVVLRDITDLSYEEIAGVLGVSLEPSSLESCGAAKPCGKKLAGSLQSRPALRLVPKTAE